MSSSTESTTKPITIDDLPPEMISELFEYLHPKDLAACSLVNKRWHSIYAAFKLQSLVAIDDDPHLFRWYHSSQTVNEKCLCSLAMFYRLVEKPLLSNLKHLALYGSKFEFDFDKLNRFRQLVHLEIRIASNRVRVNLPRLQVLVFYQRNGHCAVSIDCPRLNTLVYRGEKEDANLLEVVHPETIRKLDTDMFGPKLAPFKNTECLVAERFEAISKATLLTFPRLKEIYCNEVIDYLFKDEFRNGAGTVDQVKQMLSKFLDEAKKLRNDFRFTFSGFQLTQTMLDHIDFCLQVDERGRERVCREYVYMKNYQLIEPAALHFVHHVDYTGLMSHVSGELPRCFFQKFTGIEWVHAMAEVQDSGHFLWFLKSVRSLKGLVLAETGLSQEFYDQLPASARSLSRLNLEEGHCESALDLNFEFIGRFSRLSYLHIWPALSFESATSLVRSLGRLTQGTFYVQWKQRRCSVKKEGGSTKWAIEDDYERLLFETENPEDIVNFFERL